MFSMGSRRVAQGMGMGQTADIDADLPADAAVVCDDQTALADEVRRDLDRLFGPTPAADPAPEPVRVAFIDRPATPVRRPFMGLTFRDAALAASAAVAGLLAGAMMAPRLATDDAPVRTAEASGLKQAQTARDPALFAMAATTSPASAPPAAAVVTAPNAAPPPPAASSVRARATSPTPSRFGEETATSAEVSEAADCAAMPTLADEMVCDSPRLAAAQSALDTAYDAALASADRPRALRREQADWLEQRDVAARRSAGALERFYDLRSEELWRRAEEAEGYDVADDASAWQDGRR